MRRPDRDNLIVIAIADALLPGAGQVEVKRMVSGKSTPVYRISRNSTTQYLRIAESAKASLEPERRVHQTLLDRGARVPAVVWFDPMHGELGRSVLVTTAIPGEPVSLTLDGATLSAILLEAGRDLALINETKVEGFGFILRDDPDPAVLRAEFPSAEEFIFSALEADMTRLATVLGKADVIAAGRLVLNNTALLKTNQSRLAHGDFDLTHIFHREGRYSGVIDFGEIRGAERFYDLGHFALHEGEQVPLGSVRHLLKGYADKVPLPSDHEQRIALWSLLIGVRSLAKLVDRPASDYRRSLINAIRRTIAGFPA